MHLCVLSIMEWVMCVVDFFLGRRGDLGEDMHCYKYDKSILAYERLEGICSVLVVGEVFEIDLVVEEVVGIDLGVVKECLLFFLFVVVLVFYWCILIGQGVWVLCVKCD